MATTYNTQIQQLYVAYFNRPADPKGLAYWEGVVEANKGDLSAVSASFAASAEYKTAYADMTNDQIVDAIYQNLFGHAADDAGKKFYSDNLTSGATTIDKVVTEVSGGAQGSDAIVFSNKVLASNAFTAALDTDAEVAGYTTASAPLAKAFLAGITTGATLDAALTPASLNKSVGDVVAKGTVFTVTGALSSLNAALDAQKAFYASADGDSDATTSATHTTLLAAQTAANTDVHDLFLDPTAAASFTTATSQAVKNALIGDQTTAYASAIQTAQTNLATAKANVDKVAGLTAAVAARDAASTAATAADKADTAAAADLAAKFASYNVLHSSAVITLDPTTHIASQSGTALFTVDSGKLVLATGVTETTNSGITSVLNSANALRTADATKVSAHTALDNATANVHHIDIDATSNETADLTALAADMGLAAGTLPTEAQLTTYATAHPGPSTFTTDLGTYHADYTADPLVTALDNATTALTTLTTNSADFNTAVASLNTATTALAQEAGYTASVDAAAQLFTNAGYHYTNIEADLGAGATASTVISEVASTDSDVFVAGAHSATIQLFGLQGKDVISVGTGYVANTGKLTTGNDAAKEVFIHAAANGTDAEIQIEAHAFSSHVASAAAPELVTITLTGVNAANLHFDAATGIISLA